MKQPKQHKDLGHIIVKGKIHPVKWWTKQLNKQIHQNTINTIPNNY